MNTADSIIPFECFHPGALFSEIETPKTKRNIETNAEKGRKLYLSGRWQMPNSEFKLEAVLLVQTNGQIEGVINWRNVRTGGLSSAFCANEYVRGQISQFEVKIKGYRAETGLVTDYYKIALCGNDRAGFFGGQSRAFGGWNGRLEGSYLFSSNE